MQSSQLADEIIVKQNNTFHVLQSFWGIVRERISMHSAHNLVALNKCGTPLIQRAVKSITVEDNSITNVIANGVGMAILQTPLYSTTLKDIQ